MHYFISNNSTTIYAQIDNGVVINGVTWATCNVGANTPESNGTLLTWLEAKNACESSGWRLPTRAELESLKNAGGAWTIQNGKTGYKFGDADNNIFLPAAGSRYSDGNLNCVGGSGNYWSGTPEPNKPANYDTDSGDAHYLFFAVGKIGLHVFEKIYGRSARCVR